MGNQQLARCCQTQQDDLVDLNLVIPKPADKLRQASSPKQEYKKATRRQELPLVERDSARDSEASAVLQL